MKKEYNLWRQNHFNPISNYTEKTETSKENSLPYTFTKTKQHRNKIPSSRQKQIHLISDTFFIAANDYYVKTKDCLIVYNISNMIQQNLMEFIRLRGDLKASRFHFTDNHESSNLDRVTLKGDLERLHIQLSILRKQLHFSNEYKPVSVYVFRKKNWTLITSIMCCRSRF